MAILVALSYILVVISCIEGLFVPVEVKVQKEHRIFIRSTPSLDAAEELLERYGNDNKMNLTDMEALFESVGLEVLKEKDKTKNGPEAQVCLMSIYIHYSCLESAKV